MLKIHSPIYIEQLYSLMGILQIWLTLYSIDAAVWHVPSVDRDQPARQCHLIRIYTYQMKPLQILIRLYSVKWD